MERRVKIHQNQQITDTDLNNMGEFPRASLDHVVHDGIDNGRKFWGFPVVASGPLEVTVGAGRYYNQGKVFYRDDDGGVTLSVADYVPVVTKRIVTVAVWGQEVDTNVQPRTFLQNVDTLETEAEAVATESRRHAEINLVAGIEAVEPQPAPLDANVIAVAYITMSPGGIESIEAVEINRITSVAANRQKINELDAWRSQAGSILDTLRSDVAGIVDRQRGLIGRTEFNDVTADVAAIKDLLELPDDLTTYSADHFLDLSGSDPDHPDWLAKVEEGVRFPHAQERLAQIGLLNQFEERVTVTNGFMLPKWHEVTRIAVVGNDGELSLSQYQFQTVTVVEKKRSRRRVRYGEVMKKCTNSSWWKSGHYNAHERIFSRGDEVFEVVSKDGKWVRLRQYWVDYVEESYWEEVVVTEGVNGSVTGQTFLNAQDGWLTSIDLYFTRVASTGDVHVLITETAGGAPDFTKTIAKVTVAAADLKVWPDATRIPFSPTHLIAGRYAIVIITPGNHFSALVSNNKFAEGSLFYSTDSAWFMGDLTRDLAFRANFAEFESPRVEVQMQPLELANGIAAIDLLMESIVPTGCEIHHEVQINSVWKRLSEENQNLLNGLPALVPYRIVFVGTTDNHGGVALGAPSTALTLRPRTDFQHVSATRTLPAPCDEIEVRAEVEWWDDDRHTLDIKLLTGAEFDTEVPADSTEERALPNLAGVTDRKEFRAKFTLGAPIEAYKILLEGTTNNALVTYHVSKRVDIAWAAE
jgi:hypothetical protein